jgi:hypothetical protein
MSESCVRILCSLLGVSGTLSLDWSEYFLSSTLEVAPQFYGHAYSDKT